MWVVALCIAIPVLVVALFAVLRYWYGDEMFLLDTPPHELNNERDYRIVKLRLEDRPGEEPEARGR